MTNSRTDLRSQSLDVLRFPLAVIILIVHLYETQMGDLPVANTPVLGEANRFINAFLRGQSVPIYYFISGYVFFLGVAWNRGTYLRKLRNRIHTLLIPYLVFNVLALGLKFFKYYAFDAAAGTGTAPQYGAMNILNTFWDATNHGIFGVADTEASAFPQDFPLWFLRDLMIVVVLTPLIHRALTWGKGCILLPLGAVCLYLGTQPELARWYQLAMAFFYFSWGGYMSIYGKDMIREFRRFFGVSCVVFPLLGVAHLWLASIDGDHQLLCAWIKQINILVGLFFAYNIAAWLLERGSVHVSRFLSGTSFFLYISHALIYWLVLKACFIALHPASGWMFLAAYTLALVLTVGLLLAVYAVMKRFFPAVLTFLTGRK